MTVVKSGFDFADFSEITITFGADLDQYNETRKKEGPDTVVCYSSENQLLCCVERKRVTRDYQPDKEVENYVQSFMDKLDQGLD